LTFILTTGDDTKMKTRPKQLKSTTYENVCGCGEVYTTCCDLSDGSLFEVLVTLGKAGGCSKANKTSVGMLISIGLRSGADPKDIIKALEGTSCHQANVTLGIPSCIDAISADIKLHEAKKGKLNGK